MAGNQIGRAAIMGQSGEQKEVQRGELVSGQQPCSETVHHANTATCRQLLTAQLVHNKHSHAQKSHRSGNKILFVGESTVETDVVTADNVI